MLTRLLALILMLSSWMPAWAGKDCSACEPGDPTPLCEPHRALEDGAFSAHKADLESLHTQRRIVAMEALAALSSDHENAPSARVAQELVRQMEDKRLAVRMRAAELLGRGQHVPTALPALMDALRSVDREIESSLDEAERITKELKKATSGRRGKGLSQDLSRLADRMEAVTAVLTPAEGMRAALARGLGSLRDDRGTQALLASLEGSSPSSESSGALCLALLQHGTKSAARGVISFLRPTEKLLKERSKARDKIRDQMSMSKPPGDSKLSEESWENFKANRLQSRLDTAQAAVNVVQDQVTEVLEGLKVLASSHGLSKVPESSTKFASAWGRWIAKNAASLPKSVEAIPGAGS